MQGIIGIRGQGLKYCTSWVFYFLYSPLPCGYFCLITRTIYAQKISIQLLCPEKLLLAEERKGGSVDKKDSRTRASADSRHIENSLTRKLGKLSKSSNFRTNIRIFWLPIVLYFLCWNRSMSWSVHEGEGLLWFSFIGLRLWFTGYGVLRLVVIRKCLVAQPLQLTEGVEQRRRILWSVRAHRRCLDSANELGLLSILLALSRIKMDTCLWGTFPRQKIALCELESCEL